MEKLIRLGGISNLLHYFGTVEDTKDLMYKLCNQTWNLHIQFGSALYNIKTCLHTNSQMTRFTKLTGKLIVPLNLPKANLIFIILELLWIHVYQRVQRPELKSEEVIVKNIGMWGSLGRLYEIKTGHSLEDSD